MEKILFITRIALDDEKYIGMKKKIISQKKGFEDLGYKVDLIWCNKYNELFFNDTLLYSFKNNKTISLRYFYIINKFLKNFDYKYCYIRNPFVLDQYNYYKFLKNKKNIILEIPTYPYYFEKKTLNEKIVYFIEKIFQKIIYKNIRLIVYSGNKLSKIRGVEAMELKNGVSLDKIPIKKDKVMGNDIKLICVAGFANWHGVDRILDSIGRYYKYDFFKTNQKVSMIMVGEGNVIEMEKIKKKLIENKIQAYVELVGYKTGKELDELFNKSDIAVGSLGMFRIKLLNGSPMKTAEYCSRGIPFIIGYEDLNFGKEKFIYKVPNSEEKFEIIDIINYFSKIKINKYEMRAYAEKTLEWKNQLKNILNKMEKLN